MVTLGEAQGLPEGHLGGGPPRRPEQTGAPPIPLRSASRPVGDLLTFCGYHGAHFLSLEVSNPRENGHCRRRMTSEVGQGGNSGSSYRRTALTPGSASALLVSIPLMAAWG